jgi:hypothetical protein
MIEEDENIPEDDYRVYEKQLEKCIRYSTRFRRRNSEST